MAETATQNGKEPGPVPGPLQPRLTIPARLLNRLTATASRGYPHEVCGLLLGGSHEGSVRVERLRDARNLATDRLRDRYTLDPGDFLAADTEALRAGLEIVGIWHTHPDHPARPSETDRARAWSGYSYMILSVRAGIVADMTAWELVDERFVEQQVVEVPE